MKFTVRTLVLVLLAIALIVGVGYVIYNGFKDF